MLLSTYALWKDGGLNAQRQERTFSSVFLALNAVPVAHMIYKINNNNNGKIKNININNHNDNYCITIIVSITIIIIIMT